jgi:hypothetical protein
MSGNSSPRLSKSQARSTLPYCTSSTHMPQWTHHGRPMHYPVYHPWGMVGYRATQWPSKLVSLWDPIKSHMRQYTTQTCSPGLDDQSLTNIGRGYHLGPLNFRSDHSSSFPSSIIHFPLIAPPGLQLCRPFNHLAKPHRTSIDRNGPIASGFQPLVFYR